MKRTVSFLLITLLLISMFTATFSIRAVETGLSQLAVPDKPATMQETINLESQEPPAIEWNKTYGGAGVEQALAMVQTADGGYTMAGLYAPSTGGPYVQFLLIKTDMEGNKLWNRTYGETSSSAASSAYSLAQTRDGGYVLAGSSSPSYGVPADFLVVKTDANGNMQWNRTYGGTGDDFARSVVQTVDGGYAVAGSTDPYYTGWRDFWLVKTDANGDMMWNKTYGGSGDQQAISLVQTIDGGYAIAGLTSNGGYTGNCWLVKTDSNGNAQWNQTYGGTNNDYAYSVVQTNDGGYALAGLTRSFGNGGEDFYLVKTDVVGVMQWNQTYGGTGDEGAYVLIATRDGGYALTGWTQSFGSGSFHVWLVKTDSGGNAQWNVTYGSESYEIAFALVQTLDGGFALAGYTGAGGYDALLVKIAETTGCVVSLRKAGIEIREIDAGVPFGIYMGGCIDGAAITQVKFSSDDSQDGVSTGEWTDWYDWNQNSGDWNAVDKTMKWSFATGGAKEVWAMIKYSEGNIESNHANMLVHPGYAIVVAGSGLWKMTLDHCANNAYRVLRNLGFDDDHIFYLNSQDQDVDGDGNSEVDGIASLSYFMYTIDEVKYKIDGNPTPLVLYFVGHGVPDAFVLDGSSDLYVVTLRNKLAEFSSETPMLIVINSCYSGSFITPTYPDQSISAENRIVITAAQNDQERKAFTWVRFSDRFWGNLGKAFNVKDAFKSRATWGDNSHSWLDDNGDKIGHPPDNLGNDGNLASVTHIGVPGTENLNLEPWQFGWKHSPGELRVYDSQNHVTGLVNGEVRTEIPNSICFEEDEFILIFPPFDAYRYEVTSNESGAYGLDAGSIYGAESTAFTATDIPISTAASHEYAINWTSLSLGEEGVNVQVDSEGDGVFEYAFISDSELSRVEYVAATTQHDLGIVGINPSKSVVGEGYILPVNVTLMNYGVYTETFNLTIYANATLIETQIVTLANASSTTVTCAWNTTGFARGNYIITAIVDTLPGETFTIDNSIMGLAIAVANQGDLNADGVVDIFDVVRVAVVFGMTYPNAGWDFNADISGDGIVDIFDIVVVALHFGETG